MTIADELRAQGREQERQQGLARQQQILERLMTRKFGPLPEPVTARIQAADFEVLERWFDRVLTADSPDVVVEL
jgi:hypothetical protein